MYFSGSDFSFFSLSLFYLFLLLVFSSQSLTLRRQLGATHSCMQRKVDGVAEVELASRAAICFYCFFFAETAKESTTDRCSEIIQFLQRINSTSSQGERASMMKRIPA